VPKLAMYQRRNLVRRGLQLAAGLAYSPAVAAAASSPAAPAVPDWTRAQGEPVDAKPYGTPSPHEAGVVRRVRQVTAFPTASSAGTPLQDLHGIITPNGLHYIRDHAGTPDIDPEAHLLPRVHRPNRDGFRSVWRREGGE
jgi:sulfane dehydrogenase subunit SoxC